MTKNSDKIAIVNLNRYKVIKIKNFIADEFIKNFHYLSSYPTNIKNRKFGLYENNNLIGVASFGACVSRHLTFNLIPNIDPSNFIEINRLIIIQNKKNLLSWFVSKCLKKLDEKIIVSYADPKYHSGYIYQALNFIYTGLSDKRTEWRMKGNNKHSKTICEQYTLEERQKDNDRFYITERPRKHRYFYLLGNKKERKEMKKNLQYKIEFYPKGENKRYDASYSPIIQGILF